MSDPAIEAAQREWARKRGRGMLNYFKLDNPLESSFINAAREALKPIRELHQPITMCGVSCCQRCRGMNGVLVSWPCATARLAYTSDELS